MREYYIKKFCWHIYAWYTERIWNEKHGDYKIVSSKESWEEVLREYGWENQIYITNI